SGGPCARAGCPGLRPGHRRCGPRRDVPQRDRSGRGRRRGRGGRAYRTRIRASRRRRAVPHVTLCWFAEFRDPVAAGPTVGPDELAGLADFLAATPDLRQALIFTPSHTSDPYLDDGPPPRLAMQLYFDDIAALETATCGHLRDLAGHAALRPLASARATQQAMAVRRCPAPDATFRTPAAEAASTCPL